MLRRLPGSSAASGVPDSRTFVTGEKMWVTKIDVKDNGVVFELFTDAFGDTRYKANLVFPFPKGAMPAADQMEKTVAEVFKVQPAEDSNSNANTQQAPAGQQAGGGGQAGGDKAPAPIAAPPPPPADAAPAAIAPPPPPPENAQPKTIGLGQTKDQVTGALGQPQRIAKLGSKEIYYYKDLKVTFVDGKVTDIQ